MSKGLRYKGEARYGDPAKNGLGVWRAGQAKPTREEQEKYAAALVAQGGFEWVDLDATANVAQPEPMDDNNETDEFTVDDEDETEE